MWFVVRGRVGFFEDVPFPVKCVCVFTSRRRIDGLEGHHTRKLYLGRPSTLSLPSPQGFRKYLYQPGVTTPFDSLPSLSP